MARERKPLPPGVPEEGPPAPAGAEGLKQPKFATPKPADPQGAPKQVDPLERVPEALRGKLWRFKIRCDNYTPQPMHYVLAADRAAAEAEYLRCTGLGGMVDELRIKREAEQQAGFTVGPLEAPRLVVTQLAD
jgi:hypothetical protein